jgi:dCMP deaminase
MKHKMLEPYMDTARAFAKLSHAQRRKVGAIAVTPQDVVIYSWNGRPSGDDNCCEVNPELTHPEVLHAESNIVAKAAREGISLKDADVYVTLSPCLPCALQLYQAGVKMVTFDEEYRLTDGIDFLKRKKITVNKYEENEIENNG